jgi:putative tryptophan/tyrosine transport system substrate-binding protein
MRRREFIGLVGGAAAVWPLALRAQQLRPVIGFLNGSSADGYAPMVAAFGQGLKETGYLDGQNVTIEYRWAEGRYDKLSELVGDLIRRQVSVIAATSTPANLVAKKATTTIPIVFTTSSDPVQLGLVDSLNRPGANVTGVTQLNVEVGPKRLELARELMPSATAVALLINPKNPQADAVLKNMQAAAPSLGLQLQVLRASSEAEMETAFASFASLKAGILTIGTDTLFNGRTEKLASLAVRYAVPTIYQYTQFTANGGLMSYGGSIEDAYRTAGILAGRILKGDKPADLPVQQSTKVQLIVNLKAARALGIAVPLSLLGRADEIIE